MRSNIIRMTLRAGPFLLSLFSLVFSQTPIHVDISSDFEDDLWQIDCRNGYQEELSGFECVTSGGVDIPEEDLSGQVGFWTQCSDFVCKITYEVQPDDVSFALRVYQRNIPTEISFDGRTKQFIYGDGWVDFKRDFDGSETEVSIHLQHFDPEWFAVLDRMAVNDDLPPPPTVAPPTGSTDEPTTESVTEEPEVPTTEEPEEPSTEGPEDPTTEPEPEDPSTEIPEETTTEGFDESTTEFY